MTQAYTLFYYFGIYLLFMLCFFILLCLICVICLLCHYRKRQTCEPLSTTELRENTPIRKPCLDDF